MKNVIILGIILIISLTSCTLDKPYEQPSKIESNNQLEKAKVSTFSIGESASDGRLKITVKGVNFKDKITYSKSTEVMGEEYNSSFDFKPKENYHFLILDITIENLQTDKTSSISIPFLSKINDADGYSYDYSLETAYLDKKWEDGDMLPGMKRRGNIAFEVPKNSVGLKFTFQFDVGGQTAVYKLE